MTLEEARLDWRKHSRMHDNMPFVYWSRGCGGYICYSNDYQEWNGICIIPTMYRWWFTFKIRWRRYNKFVPDVRYWLAYSGIWPYPAIDSEWVRTVRRGRRARR